MGDHLFGFDIDNKWDYENGFHLTSHVNRLAKIMAQYELYKSIIGLPGHIVECGVYKGASLIRLATFREILECGISRKIIAFDTFGKFPIPESNSDSRFVEGFVGDGGEGISVDELDRVLSFKSFKNYELIKGDIIDTVPRFAADNPELKIALLHIDVDVYRPTTVILDELYNRVVPGGILMLDDYGTVAGETDAVDEFIAGHNVALEKLPISHVPTFIRKQ
ncbi:MAG: TylF/MycF/NovP-related O-methyltransferase [Candidatus Sedimenticola sp. PURPLELP]